MVTYERLHELFSYDPETGFLFRKIAVSTKKVGDVAGCLGSIGYMQVSIGDRLYLQHRIIWCMQTGSFPQNAIDHIDGNRSNNKWSNLREATLMQNQCNRGIPSNNTTGAKGVTKIRGKFQAGIAFARKRYHLGWFATIEEAKAAYDEAAIQLHGKFYRQS